MAPDYSAELAELIGIMFGDGGISLPYQAVISLSALLDNDYVEHVYSLIVNNFGILPSVRLHQNENVVQIRINSVEAVDSLLKFGCAKGDKIKSGLKTPGWINSNRTFCAAFLRGLFDTDGCVFLDKHIYKERRYCSVGIALTTYSEELRGQIKTMLEHLGYNPTVAKHNILIRREPQVLSFLSQISSCNARNLNKIQKFLEEYRSGYNGTVSKAVVQAIEP